MRVNGELFLLDNALMNGLVLLLASALSGLPRRQWCIGAGLALLGALYGFAALGYWDWLLSWPFRFGYGFVLALGLRVQSWREYAAAAACTLLSAFLLGGLALALAAWMGGGMEGGLPVGTIPLRIALWAAALSAMAPRLIRAIGTRRWRGGAAVTFHVSMNGKERAYRGLVDTGNLLTEPITGLPVALIRGEPFREGLPVPYGGIGGEGILIVRRPRRAVVKALGDRRELHIWIARTPGPFPEGIDAILPGMVFLEPEKTKDGGDDGDRSDTGLALWAAAGKDTAALVCAYRVAGSPSVRGGAGMDRTAGCRGRRGGPCAH